MILVDTSAWVEFDRATGSRVDTALSDLIANTDEVAVQTGVTPRGMVDCMIAAVAWRYEASILTSDADLTRVGEIMGIEVEVP